MHWLYWSLLSAVFAAITAILAKIGVTQTDSNIATAVRTSVILVLSWAVVLATKGLSGVKAVPTESWLPLVGSGIATGLSWLCYFKALQEGPASKVAPIDKLSVVFVVVLSVIFLHEPVTMRSVIGVVLIAAGAFALATG